MRKLSYLCIIATCLFITAMALMGCAGYAVYTGTMIPSGIRKLILLGIVGMAALSLIIWLTYFLLFKHSKKTGKGQKRVLGVISVVLSVLLIICSLLGTDVVHKMNKAVRSISGAKTEEYVVGVYVLDEDPAQTLADAKNYEFGINHTYNYEGAKKASEEVAERLGSKIKTKEFDNVFTMLDGLKDGEVGAVFMDDAFIAVLDENPIYANFDKWARKIDEVVIVEEKEPVESEPSKEESSEDSEAEESREDETGTEAESEVKLEPFIVYLSGLDTRSQTLQRSRSDVNILAVVNPESNEVLLLNTPRDYYVLVSESGFTARDKLTHCGIFGIDCSMETLENLYDLDIKHFAQINFTGFETIIDALGGVTVQSDMDFKTGDGYTFTKGPNEVNGAAALSYARERHTVSGGDNARGIHQMQLLQAIAAKAASSTTLLTNYTSILNSMQDMIRTDCSYEELCELIEFFLGQNAKWDIHTYAVNGSYGTEGTYTNPSGRASVTYVNEQSVKYASELVDRVLSGEKLTDEDVQPYKWGTK